MNRALMVMAVLLGSISFATQFRGDASAQEIAGVVAPTPVQEHSCIAVQLEVGVGTPLSGVTWYHNDTQEVFPRLLLMEGEAGAPPDLAQTALILADLGAESLGWGQVLLEAPVSSRTGYIDVVFEFPAWTERTGTGSGGGPGLGYAAGTGEPNAWASPEGAEWIRLHGGYRIEVSPVVHAARGAVAPQSLHDLAAEAPKGWWTDVQPEELAASESAREDFEESVPRATRERALLVAPNPLNPRTEISFYVGTRGEVSVDVYDVRGRRVAGLLSRDLSVGPHATVWEGTDHSGRQVASGVYFVRVRTPDASYHERVALVR